MSVYLCIYLWSGQETKKKSSFFLFFICVSICLSVYVCLPCVFCLGVQLAVFILFRLVFIACCLVVCWDIP